MKSRPLGPKAMSVVPFVAPLPAGCSPAEISSSFSPCGVNFNTIELDESTVQMLPCGSYAVRNLVHPLAPGADDFAVAIQDKYRVRFLSPLQYVDCPCFV